MKKALHSIIRDRTCRRGSAFVAILALAGRLIADTGTTNILNSVTNDLAGPFTLGDSGPFNFLLVTGERIKEAQSEPARLDFCAIDPEDWWCLLVGRCHRQARCCRNMDGY